MGPLDTAIYQAFRRLDSPPMRGVATAATDFVAEAKSLALARAGWGPTRMFQIEY